MNAPGAVILHPDNSRKSAIGPYVAHLARKVMKRRSVRRFSPATKRKKAAKYPAPVGSPLSDMKI
jgi:hypothetical protein